MELFDDHRPALGVTEIAELTGLNRSTCHRFCQTLKSIGYLEEVDRRPLRPGLKAVSLARAALSSRELPELAMPYLQELRNAVNEAMNMSLLDGTEIVYVARILSNHLITLRLYVGSRLPAYATSMGRVILAYLSEAEADAVLDRSDLRLLTEHTITDRSRLKAELRLIEARGVMPSTIRRWRLESEAWPLQSWPPVVGRLPPSTSRSRDEIEDVLAPQLLRTAHTISALVQQVGLD